MTTLDYSRLYGWEAKYLRNNLFAGGSTGFVLSAHLVNEAVNQWMKESARAQAAVKWRDQQSSSVVITNKRVMCGTARGWLSFPYQYVSEFQPELDSWSVIMDFATDAGPLKLTGPAAPAAALLIGQELMGDRWTRDPRLARLS